MSAGCICSKWKSLDILACVEVLELSLRNAIGSNDLMKGTGCSCRKYSSGVWKTIPTLEAKSLLLFSIYKGSLKVQVKIYYLSEHA